MLFNVISILVPTSSIPKDAGGIWYWFYRRSIVLSSLGSSPVEPPIIVFRIIYRTVFFSRPTIPLLIVSL